MKGLRTTLVSIIAVGLLAGSASVVTAQEGERAAPIERYPWDGVSNLRLLGQLESSVVVGVY